MEDSGPHRLWCLHGATFEICFCLVVSVSLQCRGGLDVGRGVHGMFFDVEVTRFDHLLDVECYERNPVVIHSHESRFIDVASLRPVGA